MLRGNTRTLVSLFVALTVALSMFAGSAAAAGGDAGIVVEGDEDGATVTITANNQTQSISLPPEESPSPPSLPLLPGASTSADQNVDVTVEGSTDGLVVTVAANGQERTVRLPPEDAPSPPSPASTSAEQNVDVTVEGSTDGLVVTVEANDQKRTVRLPPEDSPSPPGLLP